MRKAMFVLLAALCCAILALGASLTYNLFMSPSAQAGPKYPVQSLSGTYAWRCTGYAAPAAGAELLPAVGQGTVTSDAQGVFKGGGTLSLGGQIIQERIEGPSHVNPDGTGSITYTVWIELPNGEVPGPSWDINFLILDAGKAIWGMPYDTGSAMSCTLQRMDKDEK